MSNGNDKAVNFVKKILVGEHSDRLVTVWGAGASAASGVPTGSFLLEKMKQDLRELMEFEIAEPALATKKKSLKKIKAILASKENPPSVEEVFSVYADWYGEEKLYQWLRNYIPSKNNNHRHVPSPPYFPSVAHELCAHLAGSHKLRYFISLNFDEILESTFAEELDAENVHVASSDDEFARLADTDIDKWRSEFGIAEAGSFILKPHGTISRRLTLRHLPNKVRRFSQSKTKALTHMMMGRIIILLGFGNYNRDFREVFLEAFIRRDFDTIVLVDKEPEKVQSLLPAQGRYGTIYSFKGGIDQFFHDLATHLEGDPLYSRSIQNSTRHRIRSHFFSLFSQELHAGGDEVQFFRQRQVLAGIPRWWIMVRLYELELLIYLLKARGLFIQMAVMECGRVEAALRKSLAHLGNTDSQTPFIDLRPEVRLQAILGKELFGCWYVHDTQALRSLNAFWCFLLVKEKIHDRDVANELENTCRKVAKKFSAWLTNEAKDIPPDAEDWIKQKLPCFEAELEKLVVKLHEDIDVDLSDRDLTGILRFKRARHMRKRSELADWSTKLIKGEWTRLRIGTTAGEWLVGKLGEMHGRQGSRGGNTQGRIIEVICNLDVFSRKGIKYKPYQLFHYRHVIASLKRLIGEVLRLKNEIETLALYGVHDWEHHMLLAEDDGVLKGGIYFKRYGKGTTISPIKLTEPNDQRWLQRYFDARVQRIEKRNSPSARRLLRVRSSQTGIDIAVSKGSSETDSGIGSCLYNSLESLRSDSIGISLELNAYTGIK